MMKKHVKIGLYSAGLQAYWPQFAGLKERLMGYNQFIAERLAEYGEVFNFGMVDTAFAGRSAGAYFNEKNVDIVFLHNATYCTSSCVLPVHQICKAPAVVLNLQPAPQMAYETTGTGEWLAQCTGCSVPEISNAFMRGGVPFRCVNGLLGLDASPQGAKADERSSHMPSAKRAWREIREWVDAAGVKRCLQYARFGFLGGNYSGMLDMYSDFALLSSRFGIHIELLEMCDLQERLKAVTDEETEKKLQTIHDFFEISGDDSADPIAHRPTLDQLHWAAKVACAQERLTRDFALDALSYYYHGAEGNDYEALQSGFIVGHSLLTAEGIPCAGEGDMKTCVAMKICDLLGRGGSFSEIVAMDYQTDTMLVGHDGPFHISISEGKPMLRGVEIYHGKRGGGISVEAHVKAGDVTMLGITQTAQGLRMIVSEGEAMNLPILRIGNTQTHVKFPLPLDDFMDEWFSKAPTHHFALSIGRNASILKKVADLLNIEILSIG